MSDVIVSIISTLGVVTVAWLGQQGLKSAVRRRRRRRAESGESAQRAARQEQADAAIADYENNPGAFIERVLSDNAQKHAEVEELKRSFASMEERFTALQQTVQSMRDNENQFRGALTRWLRDVFWAWGKSPDMPQPQGDDVAILRPVLPWVQ